MAAHIHCKVFWHTPDNEEGGSKIPQNYHFDKVKCQKYSNSNFLFLYVTKMTECGDYIVTATQW
jgi:hypothetical protein